jgi:hypothetical protein
LTTHEHSYLREKNRKFEGSLKRKIKKSPCSMKNLKNKDNKSRSKIISPKFLIDSSLSSSILEEIQAFKEKKILEFRKTLEKSENVSLPVREK